MAKKPFQKVPCHVVVVAGSAEAAKRVPGGADASGCRIVAARRRMGVRLEDPKPELGAKSLGKPCSTKRKSCPLQLIFQDGVPYLRLCKKAGNRKPGYLVPAGTPAEAAARASELCACWRANRKRFEKCNIDRTRLGRARR